MPKRSPGSGSLEDINRGFGARLRFLRETAGRSQSDIGQALEVSFQQIQKYENGTTSISLNRLEELARYFSVSVGHLVDGLGPHDPAALSGFAEGEQAGYEDGSPPQPKLGPLPKDAVALLTAFARIDNRKLRRSILTMVEASSVNGIASHDEDDSEP